jgi:hypothetical protein
MPVRCADCNATFLLTPDGVTQSAACEHCGGTRLERDQPSPTRSDGDLRDMVDPGIGLDQGGNPNQEGIWATVDGGWQPYRKRDESFASVLASQNEGVYEFSDEDGEVRLAVKLAGGSWSQRPGEDLSTFFDRFQRDVNGDPAQAQWAQDWKQKVIDLRARKQFSQHNLQWQPGQRGRGLVINNTLHTWPVNPTQENPQGGLMHGEYAQHVGAPDHMVDFASGIEIQPDGSFEELAGRGAHPYEQYDPRLRRQEMNFNFGSIQMSITPARALPQDPYLPWTHLADAIVGPQHHATVTPGPLGIHAGTTKWLQFLDAHVDGVPVRGNADHIIRTYGSRNNPKFGQPVQVSVHHPEHLEGAAETIETSALGHIAAPKLKMLAQGIAAGTHPAPPGIDPSQIKIGATKTAGPAAALLGLGGGAAAGGAAGGGLLSMAAPALMRGALMGTGSQMIQGLIPGGGGQDAAGQGASVPPPPRDLAALSRVADIETPHSNPGYFHDNPEEVDTQEFDDQSTSTEFQNPNNDAEAGGAQTGEDPVFEGFRHDSPGLERAQLLAPLLMHYYNSEDSAASDPMVRELHEQLDRENPGYLEKVGPDHEQALEELLKHIREPDAVTAKTGAPVFQNTPIPQAQMQMGPAQNQGQLFPGTVPGQGHCPYCGGTTTADGSCPQCGAKTQPMGGSVPPGGNTGYSPVSMPTASVLDEHVMAANHQGPTTPEQISAVQQLLIEQGREKETPNVPIEPWNYVREMAQITEQQNVAPNVDPNQQPQMPQAPAVPPMDPSQMQAPVDPSQMMPVAHTAADNIAPRCPNCNSATTGITGGDYDGTKSAMCHACGSVWEINNTVREKIGAEDGGNVVGVPAADQEGQHDIEQEQDSSHSWQTSDGEPLHVGQEYELHSPSYSIPDIIKVDAIKPDAIVVSTIGEYSPNDAGQPQDGAPLTYQREIPREEVDLEQLTFVPSDGNSQAGEQSLEEYQQREQAPVNTEPVDQPHIDPRTTSAKEEPEEQPELRDDVCPTCMSTHVASQLSSPTTSFHECYKCGAAWETKEEDYIDENTANRQWLMDESGPGGDDFFAEYERVQAMRESGQSRSLSDIAARDPRQQAIRELLDANKHEAGKKFTPREQREFIDEQGVARNADKLDLAGTHYESHRYLGEKANADNAPDEHMFLGL